MTPEVLKGAGIGLLGAVGLLNIVWRLRARKVSFEARVAPYVGRRDTGSGLLEERRAITPFATIELLLAPWVGALDRMVERLGTPTAQLKRRLLRAGSRCTVEQFRTQQLLWATAGLAGGLFLALVLAVTRQLPVPLAACLVLIAGACGAMVRDRALGSAIKRREEIMLLEFPTIAELLALAVTAGEAPVAALQRVARTASGELAHELRMTLADVHAGASLSVALEGLADRTGLAPLGRFAEGVAVAIERGTPVADVLRAQAQDVREQGKRTLMEVGGRKEVLMLVPVVFLVLPVTVVFAVFPSVFVLRIGL